MRARWAVGFIGTWLGCVLLESGSLSAEPFPLQEAQRAPSQVYYDARERLAATMTFEWVSSGVAYIPAESMARWNQTFLKQPLTFHWVEESGSVRIEASKDPSEEVFLPSEGALLPEVDIFTEVSDHYLIERTPERLRLRMLRQSINMEKARNPYAENSIYPEDIYFQGNTAVVVIYNTDGAIAGVEISESGKRDVLGLGSPSGTDDPCMLVFLGGVSPLRLMGSSPQEWRLSESTPEEWVFERIKSTEGMPQIKVHLDRRYQDAPSQIEIIYRDGATYTWRTLKYKCIQGMWFPSEVEFAYEMMSERGRDRFTLVRAVRTKEVNIDIPEGTPVRDLRKEGLGAWGYFESSEEMDEDSLPESEEDKRAGAEKVTRWDSTLMQSIFGGQQGKKRGGDGL